MILAAKARGRGSGLNRGRSTSLSDTPCRTASLNTDDHLSARVALLTGGGDKPYALGLAAALTSEEILLDFIGSDDLAVPELLANCRVKFLNLRRDQRSDVNLRSKAARVLTYYWRLLSYAANAEPKLLHILWNNKFELFDRTLLMLYYKLLGKEIVLTAHNVNIGKRDSRDTWLNRLSLIIQYSLSDHIFVHTRTMKRDLASEFAIPQHKITVIPFGINNTVPNTSLSTGEAKRQLGITGSDKTILFFGNIAPYKGLEYLVSAVTNLLERDGSYRLIIVGRPKERTDYWQQIRQVIASSILRSHVTQVIKYVPDEVTELYFKAADVLVLPYTHVSQSGVLFLGYSFGLPVIAANVGNLKEEIIEGKTGLVFNPRDSLDLARKIEQYFNSELFRSLESERRQIRRYANERYSWSTVGEITAAIYSKLLSSR
jgi:glycosyltransferase involved in cell wall biosynthesis